MNCTWKDCDKPATQPQVASDGEIWANLCDEHHEKLEESLSSLEPKKLLSAWVKAQGGANKAAKRMTGD